MHSIISPSTTICLHSTTPQHLQHMTHAQLGISDQQPAPWVGEKRFVRGGGGGAFEPLS